MGEAGGEFPGAGCREERWGLTGKGRGRGLGPRGREER